MSTTYIMSTMCTIHVNYIYNVCLTTYTIHVNYTRIMSTTQACRILCQHRDSRGRTRDHCVSFNFTLVLIYYDNVACFNDVET